MKRSLKFDRKGEAMKKNFWVSSRKLCAAFVVILFAVCGGCGDYTAVGVAGGYGPAYYAPDYVPLFGFYGYDGFPYWGNNVYVRNRIVVRDRDRDVHKTVYKNVYYGGHHIARNWGGRTPFRSGSVQRRARSR
jgi:hypothetical protein